MSFGGHALDMIKRLKENRDMVQRGRDRRRELQKKMINTCSPRENPDITLEKLKRVEADTKLYEEALKKRTIKLMLVAAGFIIFCAVIVYVIFRLYIL